MEVTKTVFQDRRSLWHCAPLFEQSSKCLLTPVSVFMFWSAFNFISALVSNRQKSDQES